MLRAGGGEGSGILETIGLLPEREKGWGFWTQSLLGIRQHGLVRRRREPGGRGWDRTWSKSNLAGRWVPEGNRPVVQYAVPKGFGVLETCIERAMGVGGMGMVTEGVMGNLGTRISEVTGT